ncbi:MAG: hypothetical protein GC164_14235 [Phycisphaera sp.]|nr:hypothetical protein [Phycisphaera sp.]
MSLECELLHEWARQQPRRRFPFDESIIPTNGLYLLFEMGEYGHGGDRIVRIGTHTGPNQLRSRLKQHFVNENKDRSVFRKQIGRSLLQRDHDPYLDAWDLDRTSQRGKQAAESAYDAAKQQAVETRVSEHIRSKLSFVVVAIDSKAQRLEVESQLISTVSLCTGCSPSSIWLGLQSPNDKIRRSGLWQINELWKNPMSLQKLRQLFST